jgi:hypothetical protein
VGLRVPAIQIEVAEAEAELREILERRRSAPLGDRLLIEGLDRTISIKRERLVKLRTIQAALSRARMRIALE